MYEGYAEESLEEEVPLFLVRNSYPYLAKRRSPCILDRVYERLRVSRPLLEESKRLTDIVKRALHMDRAPPGLSLASLIYTSRERGVALTLESVVQASRQTGNRIKSSSIMKYLFIIEKFAGKRDPTEKILAYVDHIRISLLFNEEILGKLKREFSRRTPQVVINRAAILAKRMITRAKKNNKRVLLGKNPLVLAAVAFYNGLKLVGCRSVTQRDLALSIGIHPTTISRNRRLVMSP